MYETKEAKERYRVWSLAHRMDGAPLAHDNSAIHELFLAADDALSIMRIVRQEYPKSTPVALSVRALTKALA